MNTSEQQQLLKYARGIIEKVVRNSSSIVSPPRGGIFALHRGAFVTLMKKGHLRGCIGLIIAAKPLWKVIREMAESSAMHDPRFPQVAEHELEEISVEISVLTPFEKVADVSEIEIGIDGLLLQKGMHSGIFLPQVAPEWNWDLSDYLNNLCNKAGLPPNAHLHSDAELFKFQAEVF